MPEPAPKSIVIEFLAELAEDRVLGRERALTEYLARFRGADAEIAAAYATSLGVRSALERDDASQLGEYRLLRELGRGGQGVVWLAHDARFDRRVALKVVPKPPSAGDLAPRLRREARAAARVEHPGLCTVYDVGSDDARAWIAMRYVEGRTLAEELERGRDASLDASLLLVERVARAMHVAHEAGIVHRDIKPGNIMLTPSGEPVVLDFGIARDELGMTLTSTGDALGTPAYMSPEQLRGERADRRADVWALGVTAYELFTHRRPFEAPTREALVRAILDDEAPHARDLDRALPRDLDVVLATALEKDLAQRYGTALDFAEDLRRVREREPIRARPIGTLLRFRRWTQRNPKLAISLSALFVVLATALAVTSNLLARTRDALERRDRLIADVANLSDQTLAAQLVAEEAELWPASEARVRDFESWLARADGLIGRRSLYANARTALAGRTDLDPDPERNAATREWLSQQITTLLASLERLDSLRAHVADRLEFARTVRKRSIDDLRDPWMRAASEVAADARFRGLALAPQIGLAPLGSDPRSGLQEFAVISSGAVPERDASTHELSIDGASAIVLVLVPPGEFTMGSRAPDGEHPLGSPNVDPWTREWDGPPIRVALDAYFIGKYELTQGQWSRHSGANPSRFSGSQNRANGVDAMRVPVETVSWDMASRFAAQMSLALPTEAQWECAARAGTTTVFYTGDEIGSLQGHANFADGYAKSVQEIANWRYATELDDGFVDTAPVGSFAPNPFGLHDVHGNVMEWCRDTWEGLDVAHARAGDGFIDGVQPLRVQRGGAFSKHPTDGRCASRGGTQPDWVSPLWGLRVARAVDR